MAGLRQYNTPADIPFNMSSRLVNGIQGTGDANRTLLDELEATDATINVILYSVDGANVTYNGNDYTTTDIATVAGVGVVVADDNSINISQTVNLTNTNTTTGGYTVHVMPPNAVFN